MSLDKQALFWLAATVGGYLLSRQLYRRVKWYWLSPIVFVPVLLYALAIPTHTRYADYARDTNWLVALLGPATVAFAIPIWQQRELLMRHWPALLAGMFAGTAVAIGSSWALAQALALDGQVTLSLLPRSITPPFAMEMSHDLGGVPELTAACVMITGVFGGILRDILCNDVPLIFRRELYASVSFASAWCYLICVELELPSEQAMLITLFSGFLFRLLAIRFHWEMPKFVYQDDFDH